MKRGLSTIISALIIILISLVAIGMVWVLINKLILTDTEDIEIQNSFFDQDIEIKAINFPTPSTIEMSLETLKGKVKTNITLEQIAMPADVVSVVDTSKSMRLCLNINPICTCTTLNAESYLEGCGSLPSDKIDDCNLCGGTLVDGLTSEQNANRQLISTLFTTSENSNRLALAVYNNSVIGDFSLNSTNNKDELNNTINLWESKGETCICCGINWAKHVLLDYPNNGIKHMIIMSDGDASFLPRCPEQNTGSSITDAIKAACDAKAQVENLTINAIGVGASAGENTLRQIAECGGGQYYSVSNVNDLVEVYASLGEQIVSEATNSFESVYLKVIFYSATDSIERPIYLIPGILETKQYSFDLTGYLDGEIIKIEIYPIYIDKRGKETAGPMFDFWEAK